MVAPTTSLLCRGCAHHDNPRGALPGSVGSLHGVLAGARAWYDRRDAVFAAAQEGPAGIGKSTVWRAGAAWASERSHTVLSCRPAESEATLSCAALGDLLDSVLDRALPALPPPQRRALEVALLLEDPVGSLPEQPPNPAHEPFQALA